MKKFSSKSSSTLIFRNIFLVRSILGFLFFSLLMFPAKIWCSDIVEVSPVAPNILMLTFKDGHIDYYNAFQKEPDNKVYYDYLDLGAAAVLTNYLITSDDDTNYRQYQHPVYIGRKSKGVDFNSRYTTPSNVEYLSEHYIYIVLPTAMESGKSYTIDLNGLAKNKAKVSFTFDEKKIRSEAIKVSQVGFSTNAPKYAYLTQWMGDFNFDVHQNGGLNLDAYFNSNLEFQLIKVATNEVVKTGPIAKRRNQSDAESVNTAYDLNYNYAHAPVYEMDFSDYRGNGTFKIVVPGVGCSYPFAIGNNAYSDAYYTAMQGLFFQRSGVTKKVDEDLVYPIDHHPEYNNTKVFYLKDVYAAELEEGHIRFKANDPKELPYNNDVKTQLDKAWGYYHDAADWDGYARHTKVPFSLMLLYDLVPGAFKDGQIANEYKFAAPTDISMTGWKSEGGNDLPDLLDEAVWLPNYYKRVRKELMEKNLSDGGVPDYIGRDNVDGTPSWADTRELGATTTSPESTYLYAGLAAYYAVILNKFWKTAGRNGTHPDAADWLTEAQQAWNWAGDNQVSYFDAVANQEKAVSRAKMIAAAALFRATGEDTFLNEFDVAFDADDRKDWGEWQAIPIIQLAVSMLLTGDQSGEQQITNSAVESKIKTWFFNKTDKIKLNAARDNAFRVIVEDDQFFQLGTFTTPRTIIAAVAHQLTGDQQYLDVIHTTAHYTLGGNELNRAYLTGIGHRRDDVPFHKDSWSLIDYNSKVYKNTTIPGYTSYGGSNVSYVPAGNSKETWGRSSAYPGISQWPRPESSFSNRQSIAGREFTINQQNSHTAFAYGYLHAMSMGAAGASNITTNDRPTVEVNVPTNVSFASTVTLTAETSADVYRVRYFHEWNFIGESQDPGSNFAVDWKVNVKSDDNEQTLVTAVAYDEKGKMTKPNENVGEKFILIGPSTDAEAPPAPTQLVSGDIDFQMIDLSWTAPDNREDIDRYEIYNDTVLLSTASATVERISLEDLLPSTEYSFKIRSVDLSSNRSDFSNTLIVRTLDDIEDPGNPSDIRAEGVYSTGLVLKWKAAEDNAGIKHYVIYRNGVKIGETSDTQFEVSDLNEAKRYAFSVQAVDYSDNTSDRVLQKLATNTLPAFKYLRMVVPDQDSTAVGAKGIHLYELEYLLGGVAYPKESLEGSSKVIEGNIDLFDKSGAIPFTGKYFSYKNRDTLTVQTVELENPIYPYQLRIEKTNWTKLLEFSIEGSSDLNSWEPIGRYPENMTETIVDSEISLYNMFIPEQVKVVKINEGNQAVQIGSTIQYTTQIVTDSISDPSVRWSSKNSSIASIDQNGAVTGVSSGRATIVATTIEESFIDSVSVVVTEYNPAQDYIIADFDEVVPVQFENDSITQFYPAGGGIDLFIQEDSLPPADSNGTRVLKFVKTREDKWRGVGFELPFDVPLDLYESLSFDIYDSQDVTVTQLSFSEEVENGEFRNFYAPKPEVATGDKWTTITVPITPNITNNLKKLVLQLNPLYEPIETILIDNIRLIRRGGVTTTEGFAITTTASDGGVLSPSGITQVVEGGTQTYSIVPDDGFEIADVLVDGASVGAVDSYTFDEVAQDHSIGAVFSKLEEGYRYFRYTVTKAQGDRLRLAELDYLVGDTSYPIQSMTHSNLPEPLLVTSNDGNEKWRGHWKVYDNVLDAEAFNIGFTNGTTTYWNIIDLGEGNAISPEFLRITAGLKENKGPEDFSIEGSNNGADWSILLSVTGESEWPALSTYTFPLNENGMASKGSLNFNSSKDLETREDLPIGFKLFPNPVTDQVTIELPQLDMRQPLNIEIFNNAGAIVWKKLLPDAGQSPTVSLDIAKLTTATYIVRLSNGNQVWTHRMVVR